MSLTDSIAAAAGDIRDEIHRRAYDFPRYGEPYSASCWADFCAFFGLRPVAASIPGLQAVTVCHARAGWVVLYDRCACDERICRFLCHELSEYLFAVTDTPCPPRCHRPDDVPVPVWRHLVSEQVVRLVFE